MFLLYIGPGLSGGVVALVVAFLLSLFTFVAAIIWYPVKKLIGVVKKWKGK